MAPESGCGQLARREWRRWQTPLNLWGVLSIVAMVAGPFGTLDALGVGQRLLYWCSVVGFSIGLSIFAAWRGQDSGPGTSAVIWALYCGSVATCVHGLNDVLFAGWGGLGAWLYLLGAVALIMLAVNAVVWLFRKQTGPSAPAPDLRFQRRLPLAVQGAVQRIEAQDHYLNVVTDKGSTLILMRLSDALEELGNHPGLQVHRSHWVALAAVVDHRRVKGRDLLITRDGAEVPVSRSFRSAAQAAGLF